MRRGYDWDMKSTLLHEYQNVRRLLPNDDCAGVEGILEPLAFYEPGELPPLQHANGALQNT